MENDFKSFKDQTQNWVGIAAEYAISYLILSGFKIHNSLSCVSLIAHSLEAYMKACLCINYPNEDPSKFSHRCYQMFKKLKADPGFMPDFVIDQRIFHKFTISHSDLPELSDHEKETIEELYPLLVAFKFGFEIRFFGTKMKSVDSDRYGISANHPELIYASFICSIQNYLTFKGYPSSHFQNLRYSEYYSKFNERQGEFLDQILNQVSREN